MLAGRNRGYLRRGLLLLLALGLVGGVGYVLSVSAELKDSQIILKARDIRLGDPRNGIPGSPGSALELLQRVIERTPDKYDAHIEMAEAWRDLKAWDKAVASLKLASDSTTDDSERIRAKRMARVYLTNAGRYDEAVEVARDIVAIQPNLPVHQLHVGLALYSGSVSKKQDILRDFKVVSLDNTGANVGPMIEEYLTDLWGDPDPEPIVSTLIPDGDVITRRTLFDRLEKTREMFVQAAEILSGYKEFAGFDQSVCSAYVEMLVRSGRIYDAHIESGIALQEKGLPAPVRRQFLETQAECSLAIGDHGEAAEAFIALVTAFQKADLWIPSRFIHSAYEARVKAGHWDWILEHVDDDRKAYRTPDDRLWFQFAEAAAHYASGTSETARELMREPFATVALGTMSSRPPCVRFFPERRKQILMLSYSLFAEVGDRRKLDALNAVLVEDPGDATARQLRIEEHIEAGRLEAAADDALQLLHRPARDRADFDQWLALVDRLSRARRDGVGLDRRASTIVDDAEEWRSKRGEAQFVRYQTGRSSASTIADSPVQLHWPQDPGLSYAIVTELIARGHLKTARSELRKLTELLPEVHEFAFQLGRVLVREGLLDSASKTFRAVLEEIPTDGEALDLAMRTDIALGRDGDASDLLKQMILEDPLGVGAVRYVDTLLDEGKAKAADNLVRRLMRWEDLSNRLDVLTVAARAAATLGDYATADAILSNLYQRAPDSIDLALVGLELGLVKDAPGVIEAAVERLRPLAASLFPDQMAWLSERLLDANLHAELLDIFGPDVRSLPSARPALRPLVRAALALGRLDEATELMALVDDEYAQLDRFLLMTLAGNIDLAGRQLRLETVPPELRDLVELCQLARSGILRFGTLQDASPNKRLGELQTYGLLPPRELELLDALLRIAPTIDRIDDVLPSQVVTAPQSLYPRAAGDVVAFLQLVNQDPAAAKRASDLLMLVLLTGERPFWGTERTFLAREVAQLIPAMTLPRQILIEEALADGEYEQALTLLRPLIGVPADLRAHGLPDVRSLRLFMETTRRLDQGEWGMALAYQLAEIGSRDDVRLLLADTLREWGYADSALPYYTAYLEQHPDAPEALSGIIQAHVDLNNFDQAEPYIRTAIDNSPDSALLTICADALAANFSPSTRSAVMMDELFERNETLFQVGEALARARTGKPERVAEVLDRLIASLKRHPVDQRDAEAERERSNILVRASATARNNDLIDIARELNRMALRLDAGEKNRFQELAFIELAEGNLHTARRYLEVLSLIDISDKQSAKALAQLYFNQLGKPVEAAEVVRRTFTVQPPPWAVTILAAEEYLLGHAEDAIRRYRAVERSPLLDDDTFYTVAGIAYASGNLEMAHDIIQYILVKGDRDHRWRERAQWLFEKRLANLPHATATQGSGAGAGAEPAAEPSPAAAVAEATPITVSAEDKPAVDG